MPRRTVPASPSPGPLARAILAALAASAVCCGAAAAPVSPADASRIARPAEAALVAAGTINLRAGTFDPLRGALAPVEPALGAGADTRYGIAQFHAGRMPSQARLHALGVDVVAYLPEHAYLVRWNG